MEKCKICGKELKSVNAGHLATHKITLAEYKDQFEMIDESIEEEITEVKKSEGIKPKDITANIFNQEEDNTLLRDFLAEFELTKVEVVNLIKNYKDGKRLPTNMTIVKKVSVASNEIEKYIDQDIVKTHSVYEAEELEKRGFKTVDVKRGPPKTWTLHKQ